MRRVGWDEVRLRGKKYSGDGGLSCVLLAAWLISSSFLLLCCLSASSDSQTLLSSSCYFTLNWLLVMEHRYFWHDEGLRAKMVRYLADDTNILNIDSKLLDRQRTISLMRSSLTTS